jgi:hypothetical protein
VTPDRTYAVVVGIEHYELESADLNGPSSDAVHFVAWLRHNGVPADHIFLFLSPLARNAAELDAKLGSAEVGVARKPADGEEIERCLRGLENKQRYDGDLLYLFWGGHGIADDHGRYLFYADTTENTLEHHFDVASWLGRLASYAHLSHQIGYIDACANFKPTWRLGKRELPSRQRHAKQSVFFAAAIGQRAANLEVLSTGKFSQSLREALAEVETNHREWPPSPRRVIEVLQKRFRDDRTQKPVFYDAGDFDGHLFQDGNLSEFKFLAFVEAVARDAGYAVGDLRKWAEAAARSEILRERATRVKVQAWLERKANKPGGLRATIDDGLEDWLRMLALAIRFDLLEELGEFIVGLEIYAFPLAQKMKVARDLNELERQLELAQLTERELQEAFLLTGGAQVSRERPPRPAGEMLRALSLSADDVLRQVAEFVLRLNAKARIDKLRDWVVAHVKPATLTEIQRKLDKETADEIYYLLCWIKDGRFAPVLYRGRRFEFVTRWPPTTFTGRSLDAPIEQHLKMAEGYSQNLIIHFLVSREYFDWSPQSVPISSALDPQPLGSTYPTVMRWRERALRQARTGHDEWTRRAPQVLECAQACNKLHFGWVPEDLKGAGLDELLKAVGPKHQVLAFDFAAPRTIREPGNPVIAAIRGGIPIMLWPCDEPQDPAAIRNALAERAGGSNLERLLERMKVFYEHDAHQWKVTLFWDDPMHKPERWEYHDEF